MQRENFHGYAITVGTRNEYRALLMQVLSGARTVQCITINPEYVVLGKRNPQLAALTQPPAIAIPDGIGLTLALAARGIRAERFPGSEMVGEICAEAAQRQQRIGVLIPRNGLSNEREISEALRKAFPTLSFVVVTESASARDTIVAEKVTILFVTFGQPAQDIWVAENLPALPNVRFAMGVGGSFDFFTGKRLRAPRIMRQLGVEWLWRLVTQPKRLPRIFRATFGFWHTILTTP